MRFNPSLIESGDGYIFVFRNGWKGSNIYAIRLNEEFEPQGEAKLLELRHKDANFGREDPRLFRLNGHLHIMYIGVVGGKRLRHTNVLFARLNEGQLTVEDVFHPDVPGRKFWEKNHSYFDYHGIAHTVYSIAPHVILRIEGNHATRAYETPTEFPWSGGRMSGGASPVLHNGEWYHFFHGSIEPNGRRIYNMGCVTFSPEPPFQILRATHEPIDWADPGVKHDNYCDVLFPGGAVYRGGEWIIAQGIHDRYAEIRFYDGEEIERRLIKV